MDYIIIGLKQEMGNHSVSMQKLRVKKLKWEKFKEKQDQEKNANVSQIILKHSKILSFDFRRFNSQNDDD